MYFYFTCAGLHITPCKLLVSANMLWVNLLRAARPGAVAYTCLNRHSP